MIMFTVLAFGLCAFTQEIPHEPYVMTHIGLMKNDKCSGPYLTLMGGMERETIPIKGHRWRSEVSHADVVVWMDGQEFHVPRGGAI